MAKKNPKADPGGYLDLAEKYLLKEIKSGHLDLREFGDALESYWKQRRSQPASVWKGAPRDGWTSDDRARALSVMATDAVENARGKARAKENPKGGKLKPPPKPNVREPAVWSWAVQQILGRAGYDAASSMVEEKYGEIESAGEHTMAIRQLLESKDLDIRRELYERVVYRIPMTTPSDGYSDRGAPIDRAEAKLYIWLKLFAKPLGPPKLDRKKEAFVARVLGSKRNSGPSKAKRSLMR